MDNIKDDRSCRKENRELLNNIQEFTKVYNNIDS